MVVDETFKTKSLLTSSSYTEGCFLFLFCLFFVVRRYTESSVCKMKVAVFSQFLIVAVEFGVWLDSCWPHILSCCLQKRASLQNMFTGPSGLQTRSCRLVMMPASFT